MNLNLVIVDDSAINLALFKHLVKRIDGVTAHCFSSSLEALDWCVELCPDVVVVDYMMPALDGLEFISRLRATPGREDLPMVMVTANNLREVRQAALQAGATDFLTKPVDKDEFIARLRNMVNLRRGQRLLAERAAHLAEEVAAATLTIVQRERETIFRLSRLAEFRDPETGSHIMRMAHYSRLIAEAMGLEPDQTQLVFEAAPMHDVGKVGIPDLILLKPCRLSPEEFLVMQRHATIGHDILAGSSSPILRAAAAIALDHHEKWDGSGYPRGIAGEAISLHGRIVAVADVFDALTSDRPYKKAWEMDEAAALVRAQSGRHFDPNCVAAFFQVLRQVREIYATYQDAPVKITDPTLFA